MNKFEPPADMRRPSPERRKYLARHRLSSLLKHWEFTTNKRLQTQLLRRGIDPAPHVANLTRWPYLQEGES